MSDYSIPEDAFKNLDKATGERANKNYIRAGRYVWRIDEVRYVNKRQGTFGVAINMTCLAVVSVPEKLNTDKGPVHFVNERVCDFINFDLDYAPDAMCAFVACVFKAQMPGITAKDVTHENGMAACGPGQPCAGAILEADGIEFLSEAGNWITKVDYLRPVPPTDLAGMLSPEGLVALGGADELERLLTSEE